MKDLEERESYEIHPQLFTMWLMSKRPIQLKELRYVYDKGFSRDSLQLYPHLHNLHLYLVLKNFLPNCNMFL